MSRLSQKFIAGIVVILGAAGICLVLFNTKFLEKYYLFQKRSSIASVCEQFSEEIRKGVPADEVISQIESSNKVIIVKAENTADSDNDIINNELRAAFQDKGIGFQKYWLWEEDYERILGGENRIRLYKQENLNYSLLVEYMQADSRLFAITMIIPDLSDAFGIINKFLIFVIAVTIIIVIIFLTILVQKITRPLGEFEEFAEHIKSNEFIPLEVHTKDELESVADNLNSMGRQITGYQKSLQEKNEQMEELLDNVSHDLKTPISLIKLYAAGMKDGLDDGTFIDTILMENQQIAEMVNKLLFVSGIDKKELVLSPVNVSELLRQLIDEYSILAEENDIIILPQIDHRVIAVSNTEMLKSLMANLITNAIKYSSGSQIDIVLGENEKGINFSVTNETDNKILDLSRIWSPYYVGEQSRNKKLSGTGLGLTIVEKICSKLGYPLDCTMEGGKITFLFTIL